MAKVTSRWHHQRKPAAGEATCKHGRIPYGIHGQGLEWQVRWDGHKRLFAKKAAAESFKRQVEADQERGLVRDLAAGKQTFADYAEEWLLGRDVSSSTRRKYTSYLENHIQAEHNALGSAQLRTIKPSTIISWRNSLKLAPNTVRAAMAFVSLVLSSAVDDDIITKNPCKAGSVTVPAVFHPEITPWTSEWICAVRDNMPDRWAIAPDLLAGLGLRQAELLGLSPDDVDFLRGTVTLRRQLGREKGRFVWKPLKGKLYGETRTIPLRPAVRDALAAHLAAFPAHTVELEWTDVDRPFTEAVALVVNTTAGLPVYAAGQFNEAGWHKALKKAGIPRQGNGCHALRHTFGSVLLANGISLAEVAKYMGHSSVVVTASTYTHVIERTTDQVTWRGMAAIDDLLLGTSVEEVAQ